MLKNRFSLFVATFLIVGLFFVALPEKGYSGVDPLPLGCCQAGGDTCIVCELGDCAIREAECLAIGGLEIDPTQICDLNMVSCTFPQNNALGCCVITAGKCNEDQQLRGNGGCEGDSGIAWFLDTECSEIPQCAPIPTNVPTLNEWGLIAMASILGIAGFLVMRRRKVTA